MSKLELKAQVINKQDLWNFETGIILVDNFSIRVLELKKEFRYIFHNEKGIEVDNFKGDSPLELTEMSNVGKEIKKHLNPNNRFNKEAVSEDFKELKRILQDYLEEYKQNEEIIKETQRKKDKVKALEHVKEIEVLLKTKQDPLIWMGGLVDWMTAGERVNILLTFLCFTSQVILKNPISVIGLGEGSTGKTHILEVALKMIPDAFILREKKPTLTSMFRRSEQDVYYYDRKIVIYGDMGADGDQEEVKECKAILKELQSDGYVNRPVTVTTSDGFEVVDLELKGNPCLSYTTVPNYEFDSQEKSRSLIYTARDDNRRVFEERKNILEFVGGKNYNNYLAQEKEFDKIKDVVLGLSDKFDDVTIVNPYTESIIAFIGESEYYKRDFDKYNGILKTITAFNSVNREVFNIDGNKIIFTTKEDIKLFTTLLETYHDAITYNLSPKAGEILDDLQSNITKWKQDSETLLGISVNEYVEKGNVDISTRSIQRYFGELRETGFLKVTDKIGRTHIYDITVKTHVKSFEEMLVLSERARNRIREEYGMHYLKIIEKDSVRDSLDIKALHDEIREPPWSIYDNM